ncbi:type II secretion system protein M [Jannaschia sp. W003]|uniref:type II secretion system protein M n=1 Tax=Jannaschia sp. W003 TaxID=2867012 RepID=UPI0021A7D1BA|nr:type II secretion system protein M [Jannaschia sp. W003]UWQ23149.1 type II secretion system protein M [Jannaschia sp. W003]
MSALARLNPRERVLVLGVLPAAALLAGWWLAWVPLAEARADALRQIAGYRAVALAASGTDALPVPTAAADPRPLPVRVTASAEGFALPLRRIEPEGERLRLTVDAVPFEALLEWLAALEGEAGARLAAVEIDRRIEPGTVSARILLEDAR